MIRFSIYDQKLDIPALGAMLSDRTAGGVASFEGRVRDHNDGRNVAGLDYEVFATLAQSEGERILAEAVERFGVHGIVAVHRHGTLAIGDCAVWVGAASAHRDEAFRACRYVIDELKHRLPIWKKEHYLDGTAEWVNCQHPGPGYGDTRAHDHQHHHHHDHGHAHTHTHAPALSETDFYDRQVRLSEVGVAGQAKLKAARVLIVGAGGLGSPAALMLAASGVGTIGIAEFDTLEASNLHRQILYSAADVGRPKAEAAAERIRALNPFVQVNIHPGADADTIPGLFAEYDLVLDCTDNFTTKYLLADAAILLGKPVIQSSIHRFEGQILTIDPASDGGCLRCLWPVPPPEGMVGNCAEVGVLGVVPGLFGTLQANEALKRILGLGGTLERQLVILDMRSLESRRITRQRDPECPLCGTHPTIRALQPVAQFCAVYEIDPAALRPGELAQYRLVDLREPEERPAAPLPGAVQLPFSSFDPAQIPFGPERPVLFVCAKGGRSSRAAEQMRARGWAQAYSAVGGAESLAPLLQQAAE